MIPRLPRATAVTTLILLVLGVAIAALGGTVMMAWQLRIAVLIRLLPGASAMQYATATGMLVSGLAILSPSLGRERLGAVFALAAIANGLVELVQNIFGIDLGIDYLALARGSTIGTVMAGPESPLTALCFVLGGSALALDGWLRSWRRYAVVTGMLGALVISIAAVTLAGYLLGSESGYSWGRQFGMAIHTALAFVAIGAAILLRAWQNEGMLQERIPPWLPIAVGMAVASASAIGWQALLHQERNVIRNIEVRAVEAREREIVLALDERIKALDRMRKRWEERGGTPESEWRADAARYAVDDASMRWIAWVDPAGRMRWIEPSADAAAALAVAADLPNAADTSAAPTGGAPVASPPFNLSDGSKGFALSLPIITDGGLAGSIRGVFDVKDLISAAVSPLLWHDYAIKIEAHGVVLADWGDLQQAIPEFGRGGDIAVENIKWRLWVTPTHERLSLINSDIPSASLAVGLLLAVLLTLMLHFARKERVHAHTIEMANRALGQEIDQRKLAEEEQRALAGYLHLRTAELQAVNQELEAFAYSVSHDLRAPLRAMDGFSQALVEDYSDKLDAQGRDFLSRISNGSRRMGQLIDDLLRLSRTTRGTVERKNVDLSELARRTVDELRARDPGRQIDFVATPDLVVEGDSRLLGVAFDNLLGNAWKFTGKNAAAKIEFGVDTRDGGPVYFVRDNGVGFDMAYAGKLFAPFQRLHRQDEFEGTGIGLATVARVVHRHGGKIWAESVLGQGATMFFTLQPSGDVS